MAFILPVVWIKYDMMFPSVAQQPGSRLNEMVAALAKAIPDSVDAMGVLLSYSQKHLTISQKIGTTGHPLHLFVFDAESWRALLGFLNAIVVGEDGKPTTRIFCSAAMWTEPAPKKAEGAKVVAIPAGTTKEEAEKIITAAKAEVAAASPAAVPTLPAL